MHRGWFALSLLLLTSTLAHAHFIWIVPADDNASAKVIFSDSLQPDRPELLAKIAKTELLLYPRDAKPLPVKWTDGKDAFNVKWPDQQAQRLAGACNYGVITKGNDPFLLKYYAATSLGHRYQAVNPAWDRMELVIKDMADARGILVFQVEWQGKPLANAEVVLLTPDEGKTEEGKTDAQGLVRFGKPGVKPMAGLYGVRARHVEAKEGEQDGKKYKEVRHYSTLTLRVNDGAKGNEGAKAEPTPKEDPQASKLLQEARAARAQWVNFPGFTADAVVNFNGKTSKGTVLVDSTGKVRFDKIDKEMEPWARRSLLSTVSHRLDDSASKNTPCAFLDTNMDHPLGRSIRVLNDELHSSYRIRDKQIMEVNRTMGKDRFSISVLENRLNEEGKFLSVAFMINFWNQETGELQRSEAHHQTWTRLGKFDLPVTTTVIAGTREISGGSAKPAHSLTLSNFKLLDPAK